MSNQAEVERTKVTPYRGVIAEICGWNWAHLSQDELINVAWVYYYFSVQFRENLEIARKLYPDDDRLRELDAGERDTDNLSPWPGVAEAKEKMNHDEFMRRTLQLTKIPESRVCALTKMGEAYLDMVRVIDAGIRAMALASYEDGGLESVFRAILKARDWNSPLLEAFKHFLTEHIKFDSDPEQGHGALCRHLTPNESIYPLWAEFKAMLLEAAPRLARG